LRDKHDITVTAGLYGRMQVPRSLNLDLENTFIFVAQHAVVALRMQMMNGKGRAVIYTAPRRNDTGLIPADLNNHIRQVVISGEAAEVPDVCAELEKYLFSDTYMPLLKLRALLQSILITMALAAQSVGVDEQHIHTLNSRYLEQLLSSYDFISLKLAIKDAIIEYVKAVDYAKCLNGMHPAIEKAKCYIRHHINEPFSLPVIAKKVGLSAPYLSRLFRAYHGCTITDFVNQTRVEEAKSLLLDPAKNITQVAYEAGFGSLQHFNRVFLAYTGCTPTKYRLANFVQPLRRLRVEQVIGKTSNSAARMVR